MNLKNPDDVHLTRMWGGNQTQDSDKSRGPLINYGGRSISCGNMLKKVTPKQKYLKKKDLCVMIGVLKRDFPYSIYRDTSKR